MAHIERIREAWTGPLTQAALDERARMGWRLTAVVWEHDAEAAAFIEPPFGMQVSAGCDGLEENTVEMAALTAMMEAIADDLPMSKVAARMNEQGHRMRSGRPWTQLDVFQMLPRLVDAGPRILAAT